jgi:Family of unknown function (DUF5329)
VRFVLSIFALTLFIGTAAAAPSPVEARKIEHLIAAVEQLRDAKFIRNGTPHDASKAADHLRLKLREAGDRVENAEDFIRLCGSRSSVSGKPYEIVFDDGKRVTSEAFLRAKLKELQSSYEH